MKKNKHANDQWVEFRLETRPCRATAPCPGYPFLLLEIETENFSELADILSMDRLDSVFHVRPADLLHCFHLGLADLLAPRTPARPGTRYRKFFGLPYARPMTGETPWTPAEPGCGIPETE